MDRKEFLKLMGFSASALVALNFISSCDLNNDRSPTSYDDDDDSNDDNENDDRNYHDNDDENDDDNDRDDDDNNDDNSGTQNPPSNIGFTINLDDPNYSFLKNKGEFLIRDNIIVAHTIDDTYIAVSALCTHNSKKISYDYTNNNFFCPAHGSVFANEGTVIKGPAKKPLKQYLVELNGSLLRVHS